MELLQTIFYTFIALGVLVSFHEFGHFWVARRCGVKVERFSIGFGTPLLTWRDKHGTEFILALLPLGGYVKMVDEREGTVEPEDLQYSFNRKSVWQRMAIVSAGPLANFLLAAVAFWWLFLAGEKGLAPVVGMVEQNSLAADAGFEVGMEITAVNGVATDTWNAVSRQLFGFIGSTGEVPFTVVYADSTLSTELRVSVDRWLRDAQEPSPLRDLGISPPFELDSLNLANVFEDGAGYEAGLRVGDQLLAINDQTIEHVGEFVDQVANSAGVTVVLDVQRDAELLTIRAIPRLIEREGREVGQLGVQLASTGKYPDELMRDVKYNIFTAVPRSIQETANTSIFVLKSIGKLIVGDLSPKNLSGPITIAKVAGDSARTGIDNFIRFVAILSIMLGVMNLLPVPVLDGGHLMYYLIEVIKGSPVSDHIQIVGYKVGFVMLIGLMIFATYNDITRPF
jgi:regulator of sigma E protease|tara:strand:- start:191 stop:1549 length:1359 start_codon:yes stop_codon:yes gene_type:complete